MALVGAFLLLARPGCRRGRRQPGGVERRVLAPRDPGSPDLVAVIIGIDVVIVQGLAARLDVVDC